MHNSYANAGKLPRMRNSCNIRFFSYVMNDESMM
jgi:hypothetical protein